MKDSGIPWIGEIPKGWDTLKIKQVMRNKSIKGFPNETVLSLYRDYGVVPKDSRDDNHNVTSEDTSSYKLVEIGDFVINKMKAWQGSMAVSQYRGIISPAYYICHFKNDGVDRRYIHHLLRNDSYKAEYMRLSTGLRVGQWDLNIDDFLSIPMVLPPVPEQQRIAEFLDRKCGEIDEAIALQEDFIEELKVYKQSVITEVVTRGLNPNVKFKDSGIDWIGQIPQGWEETKVLNLLSMPITDGPHETPKLYDKGIPFISADAVSNGCINFENKRGYISEEYYLECCKKYTPQKGDIYMIKSGASTGRTAIVETDMIFTIWSPLAVFRVNPTYLYERFLLYVLRSDGFQKQVENKWTYGTQQNIGMRVLERLIVSYPTLKEQHQIADYLDNKCTEIDSLIAIKQQKIEELKDYKKSIIYEYVTGKKEVDG
ncbi:MAG: restriction endonuclease subunit S [Bacteroidales bacterium]|nr:restriction endonuclease subunit S [Bacteroidales bacterium]